MLARWLGSLALLVAVVVGVVASVADPSAAAAAEPVVVLKIASAAPAGSPWDALLKDYKKSVEARAGGRLKVKLQAAAAGDENEAVRRCKDGQVQAVAVPAGAVATLVPELDVVQIPFLFHGFEEADDVIDHLVTPALEPVLREQGLVLGFWEELGFRQLGHRSRFLKSPADLAGQKMRAQESQVHLEMYKNLGGSPVPVPASEVVTALKNGTVDGFDQALTAMLAAGWHQTIKFVTLSSHIYQPSIVVFNRAWFDGLPAELQTILLEEGRTLQARGRTQVRQLARRQVKTLTDAGVQVYELTEGERDAFEAATAPGRQRFRKSMGKRAARLLDDAEARLAASRRAAPKP
jgi:TRAP-type C4-dicarboxylate transport system substrate-binding protein